MLTVPSDLQPETFGPDDLAVPCGAGLTGTGNAGRLVFQPGRYPVTEPLLLTDGTVTLYVAGGELEIVGERVRYRATETADRERKDPRASFMLLAGLVLLTVVYVREPLHFSAFPSVLLMSTAYRLALGKMFPGKPARVALLWTDGPRLPPPAATCSLLVLPIAQRCGVLDDGGRASSEVASRP